MAGMPIGFRVDNAEVLELFARAPTAVKRRLTQLVEGGAIDVQREMRQQAPVAVTGYLRRSVQYRFSPGLIQAIIEPQAKYAAAIEEGAGRTTSASLRARRCATGPSSVAWTRTPCSRLSRRRARRPTRSSRGPTTSCGHGWSGILSADYQVSPGDARQWLSITASRSGPRTP